jgi:hypothetical protein
MKSYILCRGGFTDDYVAKIRNAMNGWHCILTRRAVNLLKCGGNVLYIFSGSPTQQKEQTVKVRFCGGASVGALTIKLGELGTLFNSNPTTG